MKETEGYIRKEKETKFGNGSLICWILWDCVFCNEAKVV